MRTESSPSHGIPCSPSPEHDPTPSNDDGAVTPTMTMWNDGDGDDGDGDRRILTAHAGGGNRIQIDVLLAWIFL